MDRGLMALFAGVCVTALATGGRTELPELRAEQVLLSSVHVCPGYCVSCAGGNSGHVATASPPECSAGGCDNPDANAGTDGWHSSCAGDP